MDDRVVRGVDGDRFPARTLVQGHRLGLTVPRLQDETGHPEFAGALLDPPQGLSRQTPPPVGGIDDLPGGESRSSAGSPSNRSLRYGSSDRTRNPYCSASSTSRRRDAVGELALVGFWKSGIVERSFVSQFRPELGLEVLPWAAANDGQVGPGARRRGPHDVTRPHGVGCRTPDSTAARNAR